MGFKGSAGGFLQGFMQGFNQSADRSLREEESEQKQVINKQMLEIQKWTFDRQKEGQEEDDATAAALVQNEKYRHLFEQPTAEGHVKAAAEYKLPNVLRIIELDTQRASAADKALYNQKMLDLQGDIKKLTQRRMAATAEATVVKERQAKEQEIRTVEALYATFEQFFPDLYESLKQVENLEDMDPKALLGLMDMSIKQRMAAQPSTGEVMTLYAALHRVQGNMEQKKMAALAKPGLTSKARAVIEANHLMYTEGLDARIAKMEQMVAQFQPPGQMNPRGQETPGATPQAPSGAGVVPPSPTGGAGGRGSGMEGLMEHLKGPPLPPEPTKPGAEQYTGNLMF